MSYLSLLFTNKNKTEVKLDLSNYATMSDLKNATCVDTSQFAKKDGLVNLNSDVNELDNDKLKYKIEKESR